MRAQCIIDRNGLMERLIRLILGCKTIYLMIIEQYLIMAFKSNSHNRNPYYRSEGTLRKEWGGSYLRRGDERRISTSIWPSSPDGLVPETRMRVTGPLGSLP